MDFTASFDGKHGIFIIAIVWNILVTYINHWKSWKKPCGFNSRSRYDITPCESIEFFSDRQNWKEKHKNSLKKTRIISNPTSTSLADPHWQQIFQSLMYNHIQRVNYCKIQRNYVFRTDIKRFSFAIKFMSSSRAKINVVFRRFLFSFLFYMKIYQAFFHVNSKMNWCFVNISRRVEKEKNGNFSGRKKREKKLEANLLL